MYLLWRRASDTSWYSSFSEFKYFSPKQFHLNPILLQWWELERMNTDDVEEEFKLRMAEMAINECCCLVYTVRKGRCKISQ